MQFLQDGFDFGLLIDGEIKLLGQHLQLISDVWQADALGGAFCGPAGLCGLLRQHGGAINNIPPIASKRIRFMVSLLFCLCSQELPYYVHCSDATKPSR